jgi:filamentous hemagglutinin
MILTATEANIDTKQANILVDNKALLTAKKGLDNQKGQLVAKQIVLISPEFINNRQGKLIQQRRFDNRWHTRTLHNQQGEISLAGDTNIVVNELNNQSGRLLIRASKLDIDSQILNNQHGHLIATGKDATHIKANLLTGQQGELQTNGALKLNGQSINLDQAITQAKNIAIQGQNLSHQAGKMRQTGAETGQITLSQTLNNQSGNISSQGDLTLNINKLENQQGTIIAAKTAASSVVARQSIDNRQGSLIGEKNVFLNTLALTHDDGKLISKQADMLIQTQVLQGRRSKISSSGQLRLTATEVDLTEANTQADNIQFIVNSLNHNRASLTQLGEQQGLIQVAQQLTNRAGDISANGSFVIKAKQLDNLQGKLITKREDLQLIINEDINNQAGLITAEQLLMMSNQALFNHQGHLQATNIDINTHQQQLDNSEGTLHALQKLTLHSGKLANQRGVIQSGSNMLIDTHGQQLSNSQTGDQQGIDAQGSLSIYSGVLKNQQGRIFARQRLNIDSQGLDNRQGLVTSQSDIKLNTTQFDNSQGTIKGQLITLDTHGHSLTNLAKTDEQGIFASQRLALKIGELINYQGHIQAHDIALDTQQKRVDNRQGEIIADNTLDAKIGELQNVQGRIQAAKKLWLNSHGQLINNNHSQATGGILSGGSLSLESSKLSNQHGQIQGAQTTKLITLLLDNQQGQIFSANAFSIDTQQQPLLNQKGILEGKGQVELQLGDFINSQAITQGKEGLKIDALRIDNQNGTLLSQSIMNINGLALNNSQGLLKSQQNTALSIKQNIDNQQGQILSAADLTIHGQAINNIQGVIQGLNHVALWAQTQIDNSQGWLKANKKLLISSQKITNLATAQAGKGIEGQQISLDSDSLHNQDGVVRAAQTLDAIIRQQLDNSQGMLSVGSQLNISDDGKGQKLRLANQRGVMVSDGSATIIANQLAGAGKLSAQKELSLSLSQWFENQGYIQAGERLVANFKQGFSIHGLLSSLGDLLLTSPMVINNLSGEINGQKSHISVSGNMRNSGLIDGGLIHISAQSLDNIGSGRIYGDLLALAVSRLINDKQADKSAVIAGRNAVNIAVVDLLNRDHALIYSDGDLVIGQALDDQLQATGRAQSVKNHSADIEAAGDLILATERLENKDIHLQFSDQPLEVSCEHFNWFDFGNGRRYKIAPRNGNQTRHAINDDGTLNPDVGIDYESSNRWRMFENGNWTKYFYEYDYQRITDKTQLINRDPALITSGKHLTVDGQQLNNENSRVVAGQNLILTGEELNNQETQGVLRIAEKGDTIYRYKGGGKWKTRSNRSQYQGVNSEQSLSFNLIEVTEQAGEINKPQLDAVKVNKLTEQTDATADADLPPHFVANIAQQALKDQPNRPLDLPAQQTAVIQLPAISSKVDFTTDKSVDSSPTILASVIKTIEPNIKLPDNSLFKLTPDSDSQYLIETDPRFTHHKKWLSSIEVVTHSQLHKRLADGYYEQRLVREQLMELTGQRRLANYQSDEQQYRALLTSGVTYGKQYNLTPGIVLSSAQMANLTSDMVWMVNKEVLLPDGRIEKVSVPQLYVRARQGDLNGNGALLSGGNVSADITAKLLNSGEIASRQLTDLQSETIHHSGRMQAKTVQLKALKDIHNLGGQIGAADRVSLAAGGDIRSETAQLGDGQSSWLDRPASIYVTGDNGQLTLKARQDIKLTASQIANLGADGKTDIQAGQNIQLATRNVRSAFDYTRNSNNYYRGENATEIGTHIQTQGDLALSAGQDLSARAANLSSGGALSFNIGRDIHITSGIASSDYAKHSKHTDKGFLSSTTTEKHHQLTERRAISSRFSGHSINATAGNEINIHASNLFGTNSVTLKAGAQLNVSTSDETLHETDISKTHNSGLMSTGGMGFTLGANRQKITHDTDSTQKKGSVIGSMAGNVSLTAGAQGTIAGSELMAAKDITVTGSDVTITAAENSRTDISRLTTQASGLTLSLGGTTGSALDSMVRTAKSAKQEEDSQLAALKAMKAGLQGIQAGQAARLAAAQGKMPAVAINLSYGRHSSQSTTITEQNTASGSRLSAGDNLTLTATGRKENSQGHLMVEGSQLAADKNISLMAKNDIDLKSASNRQKVNSKNASQGLSMGIGYGTDGWSANVGANKSQGFEKGNSQFFTDSQLNAGQQLTIESGQDTKLTGAQVSGETVKVDVGGNLRLTSQQLIDKYAAQQTRSSLGASIRQGGGGSLNVYANKSELHSDYQSVDKQTAINAGQGGFVIRVGKHTQLDGAVIGSTAEVAKNKLDTGTLGFGASKNRAEYKVDSQSGGFSSGGATLGEQFVTNAAGSLLTNMNNQGKASNTTHSAVSEGQLIIRDQDKQQQEVADLSRDVDKAHVKLKPIFDKQQAQKRIERNQLLGELGQQITDIAVTEATIRATQAVNENTSPPTKEQRNEAKQALEQQGKTVSDSAIDNYLHEQAIQATINSSGWGVGGTNRRIVEAGTALIQGLANGDVSQAVANASAPYIANQIGQHIGEDNKAGRLAAHGIANVALALAKNENAGAQSLGQ